MSDLFRSIFGRSDANKQRRDERDEGSHAGSLAVVVGLGNPGRRYERTRHNAGFMVAEEFARRHGASWRSKKRAEAAEATFDYKSVALVKPMTMMNNSGAALSGYAVEDLIVVHDELDLPPGEVRVKVAGGAGGHNGLRSIIQRFGNDFVRVRVGVGRPPDGMSVTDYVLGNMEKSVREEIPTAADAVEKILTDGPERAMDVINQRRKA